MSALLDHICAKLVHVRHNPDGSVQAACPICAKDGRDSTQSHLRVWPSGAFSCAAQQGDHEHNRLIRAFIRGNELDLADLLLTSESEYVEDADPRIDIVKVYDEEMLGKLVPDYGYWVNRSIKEEVLKRLGGGVAPADEKSKLSGRYVIPCRDDKARIVGWTGRILTDSTFAPRYKILGRKAHFIFPHIGICEPAIKAKGEVILVEGQGCAMALMSAGIENVLCLFGTELSSKIVSLIVAYAPNHIIVATNNEGSGIGNRAAESIRKKLLHFVLDERVEIRLPIHKDFNEMTQEEIIEWYNKT